MCLTVPFPLLPSRNGHEYQKIRINGSLTEYPISAAILPEGEYSVEVAVVLGNHDTTATGEGNAMRALSNIHVSIAGECLKFRGLLCKPLKH